MKRSEIPPELKALKQWVNWKAVPNPKKQKPDKVPFDACTGNCASVSDPGTWTDFDTARRACLNKANGYAGLGFVLTEGHTILDLDKCRDPEAGSIDEWAVKIVKRLNTRTEVSPSGTGLHVILRGKVPGPRARKGNIEMYDHARYITMTGRVVHGPPETVEERQQELEVLYAEIFRGDNPAAGPAPESARQSPSSRAPVLTDQQLIEKATASNPAFAQLWRGDSTGYPSDSEADLAFCNHLAFWTAKDKERMDRLFRQSARMREKWERPGYRDLTLDTAIKGTTAVYEPRGRTVIETEMTASYYDAGRKSYWILNSRGEWIDVTETSLRRQLKAAGYSPHAPEGSYISPLDQELINTQCNRDVAFAGPLAGYPKGVRDICGHRILITESPHLIEPKAGEWPVILALLNGLFQDPIRDQVVFILGWLKIAVEALRAGQVRPGQVLAIAGPRDSGKSLLQNLITQILGGRAAKPFRYMSGTTPFNGELFGAEHLLIEDEVCTSDMRSRRYLGARFKDFTVNEVQSHHAKHRQAISLIPFWRVSVTLNDEPENLLILPPLDESLADKIILLKAHKRPMPMSTQSLEERKAFWSKLCQELPALIQYLIEFEIPEDLKSERFGVTHYHHPELLLALDDLSPELRLLSLIDADLFDSPAASPWEGTADNLERRLRQGTSPGEVSRLLTFNTACGVFLGRLHQKFPVRVQKHRDAVKRKWIILPP